jgi:hypothetical protein
VLLGSRDGVKPAKLALVYHTKSLVGSQPYGFLTSSERGIEVSQVFISCNSREPQT